MTKFTCPTGMCKRDDGPQPVDLELSKRRIIPVGLTLSCEPFKKARRNRRGLW